MSGASLQTAPKSPTHSADAFVLSLWTDDAGLARRADAAGVERIGVDLERLGKAERQSGLGTWISPHTLDDAQRVAGALDRAAPFARVDPLNDASSGQVEALIACGVRVLMLPMVMTAAGAAAFVDLVRGRAVVVLLVEHVDALRRLDELVAVDGVDEVHIGLNDLALSLGVRNRWMALAGDLALDAGATVRAAGKRFGLGAVGLAGDTELPVPTDLVYAEYARTGATAALVSRSFLARGGLDLGYEIHRVREELAEWRRRPAAELAAAHAELGRRARSSSWWTGGRPWCCSWSTSTRCGGSTSWWRSTASTRCTSG